MPSLEIRRPMMKCLTCGAWWSGPACNAASGDARRGDRIDESEWPARCGCGGELAHTNLQAHVDHLPYVPFDPTKAGSPPKPTS